MTLLGNLRGLGLKARAWAMIKRMEWRLLRDARVASRGVRAVRKGERVGFSRFLTYYLRNDTLYCVELSKLSTGATGVALLAKAEVPRDYTVTGLCASSVGLFGAMIRRDGRGTETAQSVLLTIDGSLGVWSVFAETVGREFRTPICSGKHGSLAYLVMNSGDSAASRLHVTNGVNAQLSLPHIVALCDWAASDGYCYGIDEGGGIGRSRIVRIALLTGDRQQVGEGFDLREDAFGERFAWIDRSCGVLRIRKTDDGSLTCFRGFFKGLLGWVDGAHLAYITGKGYEDEIGVIDIHGGAATQVNVPGDGEIRTAVIWRGETTGAKTVSGVD